MFAATVQFAVRMLTEVKSMKMGNSIIVELYRRAINICPLRACTVNTNSNTIVLTTNKLKQLQLCKTKATVQKVCSHSKH